MKKEEEDGRDAVADGRRVDYLTPFLANVKDPNNLTKDEGRHVRDACLKALKERCVVRRIESRAAREGRGGIFFLGQMLREPMLMDWPLLYGWM